MKNAFALLLIVLLFNSCKKEDSIEHSINPEASFSFTVTSQSPYPDLYTFKNESKNATSFTWYFSPTDSSIEENPSFCFSANQTYSVTLIARDGTKTSAFTKTISISNLNSSTKPFVDFELLYDVDHPNTLYFNNKSFGYTKLTWDFGDGSFSNETNPVHTLNNVKKEIKLIAENQYTKDSITVLVTSDLCYTTFNNFFYLLTNTNPIEFTFYKKDYSEGYGISYFSFGDSNKNPRKKLEQSITNKFDSEQPNPFIQYLTCGKVTKYKKYSTMDVTNFGNILNNIIGNYHFYYIANTPLHGSTTILDTATLKVNLLGNSKIYFASFSGYLSSNSTKNTYRFETNMQNVYSSLLTTQSYIDISKNLDSINAAKIQTEVWGPRISFHSWLIYKGIKL